MIIIYLITFSADGNPNDTCSEGEEVMNRISWILKSSNIYFKKNKEHWGALFYTV